MNPLPRYEAPGYKGSDKLKGKVALITGGDSGIGRAVAVLFAREGANVSIVYLQEEQRDARSNFVRYREGGPALPVASWRCDLVRTSAKTPCNERLMSSAKLDILVNNAAYQMQQDRFEDISVEQFDRTFKTNIYGYFYMVKAAIEHLKHGSSIINTGSIAGNARHRAIDGLRRDERRHTCVHKIHGAKFRRNEASE